jgi:hypothetical protein
MEVPPGDTLRKLMGSGYLNRPATIFVPDRAVDPTE